MQDFISKLANAIVLVDKIIWIPILVIILSTGIYYTIKLKFIQLLLIPESIRLVFSNQDEGSNNKISSLGAFFVGLASRVGAGNIAGVGTAVITGGPGAIFWMWVVAFFVAASSFVENIMAQIFKEKESTKGYVGGPSYYINKGLNKPKIGIIFSIFLICCYAFSIVSIQSNTISTLLQSTFSVENPFFQINSDNFVFPIIIGLILAFLTGIVLFFGAKFLVDFSSFIVPIMAIGYILVALLVVILNLQDVIPALTLIISDAFTPNAVAGATLGGVIIVGAQRGMFSNEAGMGSTPNASATATTSHPVKQGLVQMLGVFIDTWVICTATGLILVISFVGDASLLNLLQPETEGVVLVQTSLVSELGTWSGYSLIIFIFFFSFTSILGNYFYSESAYEYIWGRKKLNVFKSLVIFVVFLGAISSSKILWNIADILMALMAFINLIAIFFLFRYVKLATNDYLVQKKEGKNPVFLEKNIPGLSESVWTEEETSIFKNK